MSRRGLLALLALVAVVAWLVACGADRPDTGSAARAEPTETSAPTSASDPTPTTATTSSSTSPPTTGTALSSQPSTTAAQLAPQPGPDVGDPYYPTLGNAGVDALHYAIELDYQPDTGHVDGRATIDMTAAIDGLSSFDLDLLGLDVLAVEVDGVPARFERTADEVVVELPSPVAAGTDLEITVTYGGELAGAASRSQGFEVGWIVEPWGSYVANEPDGARNWFPADDHPSDKATFDLAVTVPAAFDVVATGRLAERMEVGDGRVRWRYRASDPTATYLASVAVGDFELVDGAGPGGLPLRHALTHETVDDAGLARTGEMIGVLAELFGPFPFETYGVLVVPESLGYALENQTLTLMGADLMGVPALTETVLVHEVAHQWAGDSVSVERWSDIWLNEGMATYGEWWWEEATGGRTADAHAAEAHALAEQADMAAPLDPGVDHLFDRTIYVRGALVIDALRRAVGDEVFVAIVREWVARFGGGSAGTDDFLALVDELGGPGTAAELEPWLTSDRVPPRT